METNTTIIDAINAHIDAMAKNRELMRIWNEKRSKNERAALYQFNKLRELWRSQKSNKKQ